MNSVIESLILKKRREVYKVLLAKKEVRPEAYFIVDIEGGFSEIMIPGAEKYLTSPNMKDLFPGFIAVKWKQYCLKNPSMKLISVVFLSDMNYKLRRLEEGLSEKEMYDKYAHISVVEDPTSIDLIGFMVHSEFERMFFGYPYKRIGNRIQFIETGFPEATEMAEFGRFANLFPTIK